VVRPAARPRKLRAATLITKVKKGKKGTKRRRSSKRKKVQNKSLIDDEWLLETKLN
jgi:hypothetical protein